MPRWSARTLAWVSGIVIVAGLGLTIATVVSGGIAWDAAFDLRMAGLFAQVGAGAPITIITDALPVQDLSNGPLRFMLVDAVGGLLGVDALAVASPGSTLPWGLVTAAAGAVGLAAVVWAVRAATRSWALALLAGALLAALPLWLGISAVAYRDIPVAAGLALLAAASTRAAFVADPCTTRTRVAVALAALAAVLIAVGARGGSLALVAAVLVLAAVPLALTRRWHRLADLGWVGIGSVIGLVLVVLTNPVARLSPLEWIWQAVTLARSNPNATLVHVLGQYVMSDALPWWYIPAWLAAQLPVLTLVALGAALITIVVMATRGSAASRGTAWASWPWLILLIVIPLVLVITRANLYDGLRHVLFMLPAIAVLIALAASSWVAHRRAGLIAMLVAAVPVISLLGALRWFPYSYAFVNPVAGAVKDPALWDLDYWGLSAREGVERLRESGAQTIVVAPTSLTSAPWGSQESPAGADAAYVFIRWDTALPTGCAPSFEIRRDGLLLGRGGLCTQP